MDLKKELVTTIENKQKLHDKYKDLRKDCQALLRTYKKSEQIVKEQKKVITVLRKEVRRYQ